MKLLARLQKGEVGQVLVSSQELDEFVKYIGVGQEILAAGWHVLQEGWLDELEHGSQFLLQLRFQMGYGKPVQFVLNMMAMFVIFVQTEFLQYFFDFTRL